jgi:hypothetical protein
MNEKERMQRVGELTSTLLDGSLTEPQKQELNKLLRGDPDACERYLDLTETHAALVHDHVGDDLLPEFSEEKHSAKGSPLSQRSHPSQSPLLLPFSCYLPMEP